MWVALLGTLLAVSGGPAGSGASGLLTVTAEVVASSVRVEIGAALRDGSPSPAAGTGAALVPVDLSLWRGIAASPPCARVEISPVDGAARDGRLVTFRCTGADGCKSELRLAATSSEEPSVLTLVF